MPQLTISKRERNYLRLAVTFGWKIIHKHGNSKGYWEGDVTMPVTIGRTCAILVEKGLLSYHKEAHTAQYTATDKAKQFACKAEGCYQGTLYDNRHKELGMCKSCGGTGIILSAAV